jgi:ferredoxin/nitrate reductase gamma subunit
MDFGSFVEGPMLWMVFLIFISGIIVRMAFFIYATARNGIQRNERSEPVMVSMGRSLFPFHKAVSKRPVYATLRYIFHACLIIVPIWFSGHILLWEESRFGWSWSALPDAWADGMTLLLLAFAAFFLIRRFFRKEIRKTSAKSEWFIIPVVVLPLVSGFVLTHVDFEADTFAANNLGTIHVLTAEAMLLMIVFLFCRARIEEQKCVGCSACEINCPTAALDAEEKADQRIFTYLPYQCISCGECIRTCPEDAVELRHRIDPKGFFQLFSRRIVRSVDLKKCDQCGTPYAPAPQVEKIGDLIRDDHVNLCERCKEEAYALAFHEQTAAHALPNPPPRGGGQGGGESPS